jgi:phosphohistidine phosphatase
MSRLMLLRHARAGWANAGTRDFDRALTESGRKDARTIAEVMLRQGLLPDRVVCSSARRAEETWEELADVFQNVQFSVERTDALYGTDAVRYLKVVQEAAASRSLLLVGHNPMLEDLALALAGSGEADRLAALRRGLPTSGLVVITFEGGLADVQPGAGVLSAFLAPAPLNVAR